MQTENGKLPFLWYKQKRKMEVCFPWSANDKRYSTLAVSANLLMYAILYAVQYAKIEMV
jgi:hypothetical protein